MATYLCLVNWTTHGIENVKESPKRLEDAKKAFKDAGANLKEFYLTMGEYDMVCIAEAPDDTTIAKLLLRLGARGSVRTTTLRAFNEKEYKEIVDAV